MYFHCQNFSDATVASNAYAHREALIGVLAGQIGSCFHYQNSETRRRFASQTAFRLGSLMLRKQNTGYFVLARE